MTAVVDNATGKVVNVDEQQAQEGLLQGAFAFKKGQQVAVRNPDGDVGSIPAEQAADAIGQGYTLSNDQDLHEAELQAKHGGLGNTIRAGAEGVARGLTFGLSDAAAREFGGDELADDMAGRKEAHGIASTGGEILGAAVPVLASGGSAAAAEGGAAAAAEGGGLLGGAIRGAGILPRAVARVGQAVGEGAAGIVGTGAEGILGQVAQRAIPMAAQGAAEGAAYGAGHEVSEASLGGTDITAEKLLAGAKDGALFGAAAGGLIGAGEVGLKAGTDAALKLVGKESVEDFFRGFANERTIKALGATSRDIQRLGSTPEAVAQRMDEVAETVLNYRFKDGEKLFKASATTEQLADRTAQAASEEGAKIGSIYKKVDAAIADGKAAAPDIGRFISNLDEQVLKPLAQSDSSTIRARIGKVLDETGSLRESLKTGEPITLERLVKARQDLQNVIQPKAPAQMGIPAPAPEHAEQLIEARKLLQQEIESTIQSASPELATQYQQTKRVFQDMKDANKLASRWTVRDLGNRATSPSDYMTGIGSGMAAAAAGATGIGSLATGLIGSAVHNVVRERGSIVAASMADAIANKIQALNAIRSAAASVDREMERGVTSFLSPDAKVSAARTVAKESGKAVSDAVSAPESGVVRAASVAKNDLSSRYQQKADKVAQLAASPDAIMAHVQTQLANVDPHAPDISAAAARIQSAKLAFLQSKLPPAVERAGLQAHLDKRLPSAADQAKFLRFEDAVDRPKNIFRRLGEGRLTLEDAETMHAVHPEMRQQLQSRLIEQLAKSKEKLSFQKRQQLGMLFGSSVDAASDPAFVQNLQAMYAKHNGEKANATPSRPKAGKIDVSKRMLTTAQRVQMGD